MEQIVQERIYPQAKSRIPRPRLSPVLLIVCILLIGFAVITVSARTLARYTVLPLDLFAPFADIFPGQPQSAAEARAFLCQMRPSYSVPTQDAEVYCTFAPATGDFLMIQVIILKGIIHQTDFMMRDNALRVGELETMLGTTHFKAKIYEIVFSWDGSKAIASTLSSKGRSSLFRPVWMITFMDT